MSDPTTAAIDCYVCAGTGMVQGFGAADGRPCAYLAHCEECDELIVWAHDDERAPRVCTSCARDGAP